MSYRCPVCGTEMKEDYSYYDSDIHMTIESCDSCPRCDYSEEYVYGNSRDGVYGFATFEYGYNYFNKLDYKRFKKKLWSYRKKMLRLHKIKGRHNKLK